MTPEELDEARAKEARRLWMIDPEVFVRSHPATIAARLARENWTPPEPVDPDVLAFREWVAKGWPGGERRALSGEVDNCDEATAYLAGARMAREQERERAKVLVEYVEADARRRDGFGQCARAILIKYRGEA